MFLGLVFFVYYFFDLVYVVEYFGIEVVFFVIFNVLGYDVCGYLVMGAIILNYIDVIIVFLVDILGSYFIFNIEYVVRKYFGFLFFLELGFVGFFWGYR